eukprot:1937657-Rhodomonas_salina.1
MRGGRGWGLLSHTNTETQRHSDTETERHRDTDLETLLALGSGALGGGIVSCPVGHRQRKSEQECGARERGG